MSQELVSQFIQALDQVESHANCEEMAKLFQDGAELSNLAMSTPVQGPEGASKFWKGYRSTFQEVKSEFTQITQSDQKAILEWVSKGKLHSGREFECQGVTLLDLDGDKIKRFKAYYDSSIFLEPITLKRVAA